MQKIYIYTITFALAVWLAVAACTPTAPGIPVQEYLQRQESQLQNAADDTDRQKMLAELAAKSSVTRNQVYTEIDGTPEYLIGPQDELELTQWTTTVPTPYKTIVRNDGTISFSFLDDIKVTGLTAQQVDQLVTEKLGRYMKQVRLDVSVITYASKSALLFGEINILQTGQSGPGKYSLTGKRRLLDLIVAAGGTTKDADLKNVELISGGKRYTINLYEAMLKGDMSQNVVVDNGDMITVPELTNLAERVYVFGEVNNVGIYPFEEAYDLLAALGLAKGLTGIAIKQDVKIIRGYGKGEPIILSANVDALLKQGDISQNLKLMNGDVVYVPRTKVGDLNEFIKNTVPLLDYLLYPGTLRDSYSSPDALRY